MKVGDRVLHVPSNLLGRIEVGPFTPHGLEGDWWDVAFGNIGAHLPTDQLQLVRTKVRLVKGPNGSLVTEPVT